MRLRIDKDIVLYGHSAPLSLLKTAAVAHRSFYSTLRLSRPGCRRRRLPVHLFISSRSTRRYSQLSCATPARRAKWKWRGDGGGGKGGRGGDQKARSVRPRDWDSDSSASNYASVAAEYRRLPRQPQLIRPTHFISPPCVSHREAMEPVPEHRCVQVLHAARAQLGRLP